MRPAGRSGKAKEGGEGQVVAGEGGTGAIAQRFAVVEALACDLRPQAADFREGDAGGIRTGCGAASKEGFGMDPSILPSRGERSPPD